MLVFMDTSVLLKLYLDEEDSGMARSVLESDAEIAAASITHVEMHSALSRRHREGTLSQGNLEKILHAFEADWFHFGKVPPDPVVLRKAAKICLLHPLRSLDAIQLSSALAISEDRQEPFVFLTADKRLEAAARREKLATHL